MKLKKTIEYDMKFAVEYFANQEGGMESEMFQHRMVETLEDAITLLEYAKITQPSDDWIITVYVSDNR